MNDNQRDKLRHVYAVAYPNKPLPDEDAELFDQVLALAWKYIEEVLIGDESWVTAAMGRVNQIDDALNHD
jgi:hypothetical protein